jgi:hypothetical protein
VKPGYLMLVADPKEVKMAQNNGDFTAKERRQVKNNLFLKGSLAQKNYDDKSVTLDQ